MLHQLTKESHYELRCLLEATNGVEYTAKYDIFLVGSEAENYKLRVGGYSGNAVDSMSYHNGMVFSH